MQTRRSLPPRATTAVTLAAASAITLAVADAIWTRTDAAESASTSVFLLGWALLVVATVVCGVDVGVLVGRVRRSSPLERLLVAAGVVVVVATFWLHPFAGSGSGSG